MPGSEPRLWRRYSRTIVQTGRRMVGGLEDMIVGSELDMISAKAELVADLRATLLNASSRKPNLPKRGDRERIAESD